MKEKINELLEQFRGPFQADGGDLEIISLKEDTLNLRLTIGPTGCRECIMPPEGVEEILTSTIKELLNVEYKVHVELLDLTQSS